MTQKTYRKMSPKNEPNNNNNYKNEEKFIELNINN